MNGTTQGTSGVADSTRVGAAGVVSYPIQRGQVVDWPALECILHNVLYDQVNCIPSPLLLRSTIDSTLIQSRLQGKDTRGDTASVSVPRDRVAYSVA